MNSRRAAGLFLGGLIFGASLAAQDADLPGPQGPQVTVSASYDLTAQQVPQADWSTAQSATLGLSARWGQALKLEGQVYAPFDNRALTADGLLSQLSLTWNVNPWSVVTFGKQRLKWGTAKVFSAVDGLEPTYDPAHPNAVLDGVTGMKLELLPNEWLGLSVLVLPAPVLTESKRALRADVLWDDTDLSAGAIHSVVGGTNRATFYADFARFFDRFGLYGEAELKNSRDRAWSLSNGSGTLGLAVGADLWSPKATLGLQVEVPLWLNGTLRWVTEYHYNDEGFDSSEASDFQTAWDRGRAAHVSSSWIPSALWGGGVGQFSRHYGYTGLSGVPLTEKLQASTSILCGLDTGFFLARAGLDLEVDQGLSLALGYTRFDALGGDSARTSERLLIPQRDQITLTVSASQ